MLDDIQLIVPVKDLTTVTSAAEYLKVHFTTVYRWVKKQSKPPADIPLHPIRIGDQVYLIKGEVECIKKAMEELKQ